MDKTEKILREVSSCVVSTIDDNNFPVNVTLTKILERTGYATLFFYFDKHSNSVKNMKRTPRGSVSCFMEYSDRIETLNLKGTFTIEGDWKLHEIRESVEDAKKKLKYKEAVIVVFETMHYEIEVINKLI